MSVTWATADTVSYTHLPENQNTLKRFAGYDEDSESYLLAYENEKKYPGKVIRVKSFKVQGVARHVIKSL